MVGENSIGIRLAWRSFQGVYQLLGILEDLAFGRAAPSHFLLGLVPTGIVHFALVAAHGTTV